MRIHDLLTNEIIDREMTDAEYKEHIESWLPKPLTQAEIEAEAAKSAAQAKLAALGLTADDLKALGL